jgi:hypothetical protein
MLVHLSFCAEWFLPKFKIVSKSFEDKREKKNENFPLFPPGLSKPNPFSLGLLSPSHGPFN